MKICLVCSDSVHLTEILSIKEVFKKNQLTSNKVEKKLKTLANKFFKLNFGLVFK